MLQTLARIKQKVQNRVKMFQYLAQTVKMKAKKFIFPKLSMHISSGKQSSGAARSTEPETSHDDDPVQQTFGIQLETTDRATQPSHSNDWSITRVISNDASSHSQLEAGHGANNHSMNREDVIDRWFSEQEIYPTRSSDISTQVHDSFFIWGQDPEAQNEPAINGHTMSPSSETEVVLSMVGAW
jgi:hypothetical protein